MAGGQAPGDAGPAHAGGAPADIPCLATAYRRWAPLVYGLARRSLRYPRDAEDVTQQVFLAAWHGRFGYRPERGPVPPWLLGIARWKIADAHTARARAAAARAAVRARAPATREVPGVCATALDTVLVRTEPIRLPWPQQRVLYLAFYEDLTQRRIAELTGRPLGTVKSRVRRGLHRLRGGLRPTTEVPRASGVRAGARVRRGAP